MRKTTKLLQRSWKHMTGQKGPPCTDNTNNTNNIQLLKCESLFSIQSHTGHTLVIGMDSLF